MFPLNPELLLLVKFFMFITCVVFWVKLAYDGVVRSSRLYSDRGRRNRE